MRSFRVQKDVMFLSQTIARSTAAVECCGRLVGRSVCLSVCLSVDGWGGGGEPREGGRMEMRAHIGEIVFEFE